MSPKLTFVLLLFAVASTAALHAQSNTVLSDTFADGERVNQNLPSSLAWYTTTAARTNLAVRNGALSLVANNSDRSVWGYFPAVALGVGDSLTLNIAFTFSATPPNLGGPGLKIGLCYTNGVDPKRVDGGVPTGRYQGYASFTNQGDATGGTRIRKRNGPAATNPTSQLLEITDGPTDIAWNTFGAERAGLAGILQGNAPYSATLRITRTAADSASVSISLLGAGLSTTNTLIELDSANIFPVFDTIAITPAQTTQAGDMAITRVELVQEINSTHLGNISILTTIPASGDSFTLGYVVGGAGPKPLVIRAAGPSLGALGVPGTLDDPKLELYSGTTKTGENDNWGGGSTVRDAMAAVGAFAFAGPTSRDAAVALALTTRDNNSVKISAAGDGTGTVIAEIYDATPDTAFTATTPRIVNMSVLKHLGPGLTVGFYVGGFGSKSVLVRAIGPTLGAAPFNVPGTVVDPQLTLYSGTTVVGTNDNWSGAPVLTAAFAHVGAFALPVTSRDAALVATLSPGSYTVQVSGVGNTTGVALVEVYELP